MRNIIVYNSQSNFVGLKDIKTKVWTYNCDESICYSLTVPLLVTLPWLVYTLEDLFTRL